MSQELIIREQSLPVYIPLTFYFNQNNGRGVHMPINYDEINEDNKKINLLNLDELIKLTEIYSELAHKYIRCTYGWFDLDMGVFGGLPKITPYENILQRINAKIESFYPKYKEKILFKDTEYANGYQLFNCKNNIFVLADFIELKTLFENNKPMTYEEFKIEFDDIACTEWRKMDEHGKSFAGLWCSDDLEEFQAGDLSYENNCRKLYELPYSSKLKLWTVSYGCRNRLESVRYSNFLCNWIQWKIYQMEEQMKQVDKQRQVSIFKSIIENIAMEPSRLFDWYLSEEEKQFISRSFNNSNSLINIIKKME